MQIGVCCYHICWLQLNSNAMLCTMSIRTIAIILIVATKSLCNA
jgi:hypothetical protein